MFHIILAVLAFAACASAAEKNLPIEAIAYVAGPVQADGSQVKGNVTFRQNACGEYVHVRIYITGLTKGSHGFHVHEKGDQTNGCASMGGHYNPDKVDHGAPENEVRHVGDLGNIVADDNGIVDTTITDKVISLTGNRTILGRGLVIHELADDLGLGNHPDSKKTGNAGGRVACGVIGVNPTPSHHQDHECRPSIVQTPSYARTSTVHEPTFYVPYEQPQDRVIYPLISNGYRYPYPYPYAFFY